MVIGISLNYSGKTGLLNVQQVTHNTTYNALTWITQLNFCISVFLHTEKKVSHAGNPNANAASPNYHLLTEFHVRKLK